MNLDPRYRRFLELCWRQKAPPTQTAEEREWLASHPEFQAEFESEVALTQLLGELQEPTLSSNFTARVLQAVDSENRRGQAALPRWPWLSAWVPRVAFAVILLVAGVLSYDAVRQQPIRNVGHSLEVVSEVASLPSAEVLKDFDAIRVLAQPGADPEILSLLQ
jgi:anti-sigma factor RsiW